MYKTRENKLLNADVNGFFNMIKKVIPDVFDQGIKGLPFNPVVVDKKIRSEASPWLRRELPLYKGMKKTSSIFQASDFPFVMLRKQAERGTDN
ncbi:MAG: hypothetical protein SWX82_13625 [Cyanobacteriota bacterium]|nr:hypothetical protein [Cyanobacteriota bacterium]